MKRSTGTYRVTQFGGEAVRAFIPVPLPPRDPPLRMKGALAAKHLQALASIERLAVAGAMVPNAQWFLYGFVRKEAVVSSQIEGTQSTLEDVVSFEATKEAADPSDVQEVCNCVAALEFARAELKRPEGLPISTRLLRALHARLMKGVRGSEKSPGTIRTSQNWIGGTRPGNARFVPPPPDAVLPALSDLEKWVHVPDVAALPPLIRAGLAHVQFETIHPFLDGNGRIGRLLLSLLIEHWGLLSPPLLCLSLAFKRNRDEYYQRLTRVRTHGDWEGWTAFFLDCAHEAAVDGSRTAQRLFATLDDDRRRLARASRVTVPAIRLFDFLPDHPVVTLRSAGKLLKCSKPTVLKALDSLRRAGILHETTGRKRGRIHSYQAYLRVLSEE